MNCQPSFRTGSLPVVGPALDGLGAWVPDARGASAGGRGGEAEPKREPPRRRVPDCDIIDVGARPAARPGDPAGPRDLACEPLAARSAAPASPERRSYAKPLLALLILQIAVVGGLHLRKRLAEAQVIVVPTTANERTVIT
jgi:hypothetical protein